MKLAFNTYVYEVAKWPIEKTLKSAQRLGFKYTEFAACDSGDPTRMSAKKRRDVVKLHRDLGLYSSQVLLANVEHKDKLIHVHLSETQGYDHTNSIIGTGTVDFVSYVHKAIELGIEENCRRVKEPCIAGIEMGEPHYPVDNPDRWMKESLKYLAKHLPELTQ